MFTSEIRPYLLTVSGNQGDWSQSSLCRQRCVCVFRPPAPSPPLLLMWCQSHGFQAPRAVNQNQILFLTALNPTAALMVSRGARASQLFLHFSLEACAPPTTDLMIFTALSAGCEKRRRLARPQMKGSPLPCLSSLQACFSVPLLFPA